MNMPLNLRTTTQRNRHWRVFERHRPYFFAQKLVAARFRAESKLTVAAYQSGGVHHAIQILELQRPGWSALYRKVARRTIPAAAEFIHSEIQRRAGKAASQQWMSAVDQYLQSQAILGRITGIISTSQEDVVSVIEDGLDQGFGAFQIAKMITAKFADYTDSRATTIARTEVVAASNYASLVGANATGVATAKQWVATADGRTRQWHADADGQEVAMSDTFTVDGESLAFPGDDGHGATAENLINCRCTLAYSA